MAQAQMTIEVLPDGEIKITTEGLQGEHHTSADQLIKLIHLMAGGNRETIANKKHGHHHHHHTGDQHHHH